MQNSIFTLKKQLFTLCILPVIFCFISCLEPHVSERYYTIAGNGEYQGWDNGVSVDTGVKKNLTLTYRNNGGDRLYKRICQQLGTKETVEALKTVITIDMSKVFANVYSDDLEIWYESNENQSQRLVMAIVGLIFDMHQTKVKEENEYGKIITRKYYDFILIGYRPYTKGFYVERYKNIPEDVFNISTNDSSFLDLTGNDVEFLVSTTGATTSPTKFYISDYEVDTSFIEEFKGSLGKDDNGVDYPYDVDLQRITVTITQETPGTYHISLLGQDFYYTPSNDFAEHPDWYNKKGYRIGGAGYYLNAPVGTDVKVNFNSKNDITRGL